MEDFDEEFFRRLVADERRSSVGYEQDEELHGQREQALNYYKGEMPDVKSLPNRSKATSSDVSDAVETVLPDLIEIFTASDDVATFSPVGPGDEDAASQESDYINHVVYEQNQGWMQLYTAFKDALLVKTGLWKWWWDDYRYEEEVLKGQNLVQFQELLAASQDPTSGFEVIDAQENDGGIDVTISQRDGGGKVCFEAVDPVDLMVGRDTVRLADATYCAHRSRQRAQTLIEQGYDADIINMLPSYSAEDGEEIERARDTAGETDETTETQILRHVEVVEHYVRVDHDEDGKTDLFKVLTGDSEQVLIDIEQVDAIPFAAITPYPVAHRFFGRSLADLMVEIQRIKTALLRMMLDSGYFAMNQRTEVSEDQANEFTIGDLLRNTPGSPVRSKTGQAVRPIGAGSLSFDVQGAMEYVATMGEQRSGIVRNAQGLNPDTLHDTASGAQALMSAAQKRVRMIARVFAETGVKDLFLGIHDMLRAHGSEVETFKLRGQWVPIQPASWRRRKDMTIDIGVGSGGRLEELAAFREMAGVVQQVLELQGQLTQNPLGGPYITPQNFYEFGKRYLEKVGIKAVDAVWSEPDAEQMMAMMQGQQGGEDPAQAETAKMQGQMQMEMAKLRSKEQIEQFKAQIEAQLKIREQDLEAQLAARGQDANISATRFGGAVG
jgi:hypothetical protein